MPSHPLYSIRGLAVSCLFAAVMLLVPGCMDQGVTDPERVAALWKPKPSGKKYTSLIAFTSFRDNDWEVYVMQPDGTKQERLTYVYRYDDDQPALSPNGKRIAFRSNRSGGSDIYVMNADGSAQMRLTDYDGYEQQPNWSPDGKKIVFMRHEEFDPESVRRNIYVMNADGSGQVQLTDGVANDGGPCWSPDGSKIVFDSDRDGHWQIYVMDADGSNQTRLTYSAERDMFPDWSPDGTQIAFESNRDGNWEIYVINADGSGETRLTDDPSQDSRPDWSPDGKQITFHSDRGGDLQVFVMEADGTDPIQLTTSEITAPRWHAQNRWPSWSEVRPEKGEIAEALIGNAYLAWWTASQWNDPSMALSVAAEELTSSWGNYGMEDLATEPRKAFDNTSSYQYSDFNEEPWFYPYVALSSVHEGLHMIEHGTEIGGAGGPDNARAMAFAKFAQGLAHGWLALMFDRAFILDETIDLEDDELQLVPYTDVMAAAVAELEQAIALADANAFTLPDTWINGLPLTNAELSQLAHSYLARMMTQLARTPEERSAVDWAAVIGHVNQGIQGDIVIQGHGLWNNYLKYYGSDPGWTRADYKTIGWLDTSGNFTTWLATPVADRNEIEIVTPDARITANGDPTGSGADFAHAGPSPFYPERGTYHFSYYAHHRYLDYWMNGAVGPITHMTTVEMQLIKAEGLLRTAGPSQEVADIINATRVGRGQLAAALASESESDLMDKLIYEKRIEGFLLCGGCAFFDRRGFGPLAPTGPDFHHGLVEGTPLHFPIPGIELERLGLPYYTFGGVGNEMGPPAVAAAGQPTRVPARDVYRFSSEMTVEDKLSYVENQLTVETIGGPALPRRH